LLFVKLAACAVDVREGSTAALKERALGLPLALFI
jgi:hypothetical protein